MRDIEIAIEMVITCSWQLTYIIVTLHSSDREFEGAAHLDTTIIKVGVVIMLPVRIKGDGFAD